MKRKYYILGTLALLCLLGTGYYNGSFAQMVCEYIRISGISAKEVEEVLEEMKKEKEG